MDDSLKRHQLKAPGQPVDGHPLVPLSRRPAGLGAKPMPRTRPTAKELVVDAPLEWVEERSGFVGLVESFLFRKVPGRHVLAADARLVAPDRLHAAGHDRRDPRDELPPRSGLGLRVDPLHHRPGDARLARARHAQVGLVGDGDPALPAHGARVRVRRLQVPARADLDDGRDPLHHGHGDVVHGLPARVGPARLLGHRRRRQHQRHRPDRRAVPRQLPQGRPGVRRARRSRASTRCTCS